MNLGLKWIYLGFLALQFVLALGNRPKGERAAYTITLWYVDIGYTDAKVTVLTYCLGFTQSYLCIFWSARSGSPEKRSVYAFAILKSTGANLLRRTSVVN